jgi:exopolysaccharide production protein ExoZ
VIWSLQTLRFLAASMIVYVHAAQSALIVTGSNGIVPHALIGLGLSGVDIFFVLSGVVITRSARHLSPAEFAWKRFRRIGPFYLLCCIPYSLILLERQFGWRDILATVLLWPATDVMTAPIIGVAWTLSFEVLFYAAVTLVLADRRWIFVLGGLFILAFIFRPLGPVFQYIGNPIILEFLFGVAIASYAPMHRLGFWALPVGAACLVGVGILNAAPTGGTLDFLMGRDGLYRVLVFGLPAAMIVYGTMQVPSGRSIWTYLGDASYSLYLTHSLAVTGLMALWLTVPVPADVIVITGLAVSLLLAWRMHELVEKPVLNALQWRKAGSAVLHDRRAIRRTDRTQTHRSWSVDC